MEDQDLYDLGTELNGVVMASKRLMTLHSFRYPVFVNNAERGFDCTYARITSREFHCTEGPGKVRSQLLDLQKRVETALRALPDPDLPTRIPRWLENLKLEDELL
jgi:hypothetical protein